MKPVLYRCAWWVTLYGCSMQIGCGFAYLARGDWNLSLGSFAFTLVALLVLRSRPAPGPWMTRRSNIP